MTTVLRGTLLVLLLLGSTHVLAAVAVPTPDTVVPAAPQRLAPWIERFRLDLASIEHTHDITAGPQRDAALLAL